MPALYTRSVLGDGCHVLRPGSGVLLLAVLLEAGYLVRRCVTQTVLLARQWALYLTPTPY